ARGARGEGAHGRAGPDAGRQHAGRVRRQRTRRPAQVGGAHQGLGGQDRVMKTDYVQRFLFENLDIRGRLVCLTDSWRRVTDGRGYPAPVAALLGHSIALTAMLAAQQKDAGRITLQAQGSGPVRLLVADCTADLKVRGMAQYQGATAEL